MVLILTCSMDRTADLVMPQLGSLPIFRFNIDLWQDYRCSITSDGYRLQDPRGRICCADAVKAVCLRKLLFNPPRIDQPAKGSEGTWCREEAMQIWQGIHDLAQHQGKLALVKPSPIEWWTKVRQMFAAKQYFRVPAWELFHGEPGSLLHPAVVKTQGTQPPGGGGMVLVREVEVEKHSPAFPWFVQQQVTSAAHDVTVVCIKGKSFAFECRRDEWSGLPHSHHDGEARWQRCRLSETDETALHHMRMTGHIFGRLDFLWDKEGLWLLKLNPNG